MQGNVEQTTLAAGSNGGQAGYWLSIKLAVDNPAQAAGALGDQHFALRQESDGPGMFKPTDHSFDIDREWLLRFRGHCQGGLLVIVAGREEKYRRGTER
jgi:hypothetical protein